MDRATATGKMHKNLAKFCLVIFELCVRTDRHRPTHHNTSHPSPPEQSILQEDYEIYNGCLSQRRLVYLWVCVSSVAARICIHLPQSHPLLSKSSSAIDLQVIKMEERNFLLRPDKDKIRLTELLRLRFTTQ